MKNTTNKRNIQLPPGHKQQSAPSSSAGSSLIGGTIFFVFSTAKRGKAEAPSRSTAVQVDIDSNRTFGPARLYVASSSGPANGVVSKSKCLFNGEKIAAKAINLKRRVGCCKDVYHAEAVEKVIKREP